MTWLAMNDGRPGGPQSAEERAEILRNNPSERAKKEFMKNEYFDQIARVLREFECYDTRVFRESGGYLAYIALDVLESSYGLTPLRADAIAPPQPEQAALDL